MGIMKVNPDQTQLNGGYLPQGNNKQVLRRADNFKKNEA